MWDERRLTTPQGFLGAVLGAIPDDPELAAYQRWWAERGDELSAAVDRAGTPWLRMFDRDGTRVDEVCMPVGHRELLQRGYAAGIVARVFEYHLLLPFYRPGYVTAFHDPGLYCPYTVSLAEACEAGAEGLFAEPARFAAESLRDRAQVPEGSAA